MGDDLVSSPHFICAMKKKIILLFLFFSSMMLHSQEYQIIWQNCFGGSSLEGAYDIVPLSNGYLIAGGTGSNDGDISISYGLGDGWVVRIDSTGNMLWEKTYGGSDSEGFYRIIPTTDNNFYLLGISWSSDGDISYDPYPGSPDYWIVKIDSSGNILWDKIVGGTHGESLSSGAATLDGGVVAIGHTYSSDGDVSVYYGMADTWVVKLSSEGELEWDYTIGTDWIDKGYAILATSDGGYLLTSSSSIHDHAVGNITCTPHSYGWTECVLFKLDSKLNLEWQNCYGGSNHDGIYGIIELDDGYMFSSYTTSNDGDVTGYHGDADIWLVKIDFYGNIIWEHCFGGYKGESAFHISSNSNGSYTIVGSTRSNDGDVSGNHGLSEFDTDVWMFNASNEGELLWQKCFGGQGSEPIPGLRFGVLKKSDNNYVIATTTDYGPSYDVGCKPHGGNGDKDIWVFEIKDCTGLYASPPARAVGPHVVCSSLTPQSTYYVHPAALAQTYEWHIHPSDAGTVTQQDTTMTLTWAPGFEGVVALRARAVNECGPSEWSVFHWADVHTCIGITGPAHSGIQLWPNPADDMLNIALPAATHLPVQLTLSDLTGRVLLSQEISQPHAVIRLSGLPNGIYFCRLASKEINITAKIIKGL